MSKGFGGVAKMATQDDDTIIYEYATYNLNDEKYRNPQSIFDGLIRIDKHAFVEPEIHKKLKKQPNGKKQLLTKRIHRSVDYSKLINANAIQVENSKFCWEFLKDGVGMVAMLIIYKIFNEYQELGILPITVKCNV